MKTIPITPDPLVLDSLRGRTVLITGGASGIGRDLAIACTRAGADVVVGDLNVDGLMGTKELCGSSDGGRCIPFPHPCDVTSPTRQAELFAFAEKELGGKVPDVVVANAGVNELGDYLAVKEKVNNLGPYPAEPRMPTVDINLHSVCTTAALAEAAWAAQPLDSSQGQGSRRKLVVIASMAGLSGLPVAPTYGCAKHGVVGLWLATCARLRKSGERRGFDCHVVCPFFALTPLLNAMTGVVLAGLPLVQSSTIASGIAQVAAGAEPSGVGSALALPDHEAPLVIPFDEFEHLGTGMYERIETTLRDRQPDYKTAPWNSALRRDVLKALGLDKPVNALVAGGATAAAIGLTAYASFAVSSSRLLGWGLVAGGLLRFVKA